MTVDTEALLRRYRAARSRRSAWDGHWRECYDFTLPSRDGSTAGTGAEGAKRTDRLFDGTAPDAVDQLAASLLAQLTPPWARWFGLAAGVEVEDAERDAVAPLLEKTAEIVRGHFDRANFAVEMHQAYLDLVIAGTASLLFEEAPPGSPSAFRFTAVPLSELVVEEGASGRLEITFRRSEAGLPTLRERFPAAALPDAMVARAEDDPDARFAVLEAVTPAPDGAGFVYTALLDPEGMPAVSDAVVLAEGRFARSPFITFRWLKAPGEAYGRSPVMKALPDIKTANKVVELVLKNASISVTGIWQADDDGVLNPANIRLVPGAIIPKAVGSSGLTPLEAPGRFDVSQLVLDDLRGRIRHALLVDRLGQPDAPTMTATEVLERSAEMARILGATYGRLQSELLTPLVMRALSILRRRGEIPDMRVDGRVVDLTYQSPLARTQAQADAQNTLTWLTSVAGLGPEAAGAVDTVAAARWLGRALGVPAELIRETPPEAPVPGGPVPLGVTPAAPPPPSAGAAPPSPDHPATAGLTPAPSPGAAGPGAGGTP
ncbi:Head-TO-tail joining protein [Caenispirillum salinarum AK4]|uniref:Head-TO-tail joining protein n=1 Tax=Caenispirillum salinarum AK4 TaxID=1238182 RepID=K9H8Y4_9PROT|nr:portal protein [Caenispirillum salinarum]EKV27053.1 Head-TO-tail joining protein [Caenispirillum salinarum AK4]